MDQYVVNVLTGIAAPAKLTNTISTFISSSQNFKTTKIKRTKDDVLYVYRIGMALIIW
ncbi:6527_t:CDS:2 [Entrophospora sp. SA101]|nr:6527_t:CDS:2 [Entrophospora sp. SA101]